MPRLLRVHFGSIGHTDARLAPLHLDFRHAGDDGPTGTGADSVLWLRNAGGKSSILNLFYSVFRPHTREFLGSSAEGKARRIEQYVKARDLGFVLTEWDVAPAPGPTLFPQEPEQIRIVGQMLAWKGQQRSQDASNLRRLFFSFKAHPPSLTLESVPVQGLAPAVASFDAFRDWLKEVNASRSDAEVVYTEHHNVWQGHLETIGLDPELFRYQLRMNQREGAADEVFRFKRDDEFVRFILELAFDDELADQIARNLAAQRESLRHRPHWQLERSFLELGVPAVQALADAWRVLRDAEAGLTSAALEVATVIAALDDRAVERTDAAQSEQARAAAEQDRMRRAGNDRDRKIRWSKGLERFALQFDEADARKVLADANDFHEALEDELRTARAASALRTLHRVEAEILERRIALARAMEAIEPLRLDAVRHGSVLRTLLSGEDRRLTATLSEVAEVMRGAETGEREAREAHTRAREAVAVRTSEITALDDRIERRNAAREKLLRDGHLQSREAAYEALDRWEAAERDAERAVHDGTRRRDEITNEIDETKRRLVELTELRARSDQQAQELARRVEVATSWRDRLRRSPRLVEVEAVNDVNLESSGFEARVRHRAELARRRLLDSRVEGAEDVRALASLRERGLLPSPVDVTRVVDALRERGVHAHAGPEYLAHTTSVDVRRSLLQSDPSRFTGAVVLDEDALASSRDLALVDLRMPVQVSIVRDLQLREGPAEAVVVAPDQALYDPTVAEERRVVMEAARERRDKHERVLAENESAFNELASELARFLAEHGGGKLDALVREADDARERAIHLAQEIAQLDDAAKQLTARTEAMLREIEERRRQVSAAVQARVAVRQFLDTHEAEIEAVRRRRDAAVGERRALEDQAAEALRRAEHERGRHDDLANRRFEVASQQRAVREERDAIGHHEGDLGEAPQVDLVRARAAYETARRQYEQEVSENQLQWEIGELARRRAECARAYERSAQDRDPARVAALAARDDLDDEAERLDRELREHHSTLARRKVEHEEAKRRLDAAQVRREAEDLPADRDRPTDAIQARRMAAELASEIDRHGQEERDADQARAKHIDRAAALEKDALHCRGLSSNLRSVAEGAGVDLPRPDALADLPQPPALENYVDAVKRRFTEARGARTRARSRAAASTDDVRGIANRTAFSGLKAQYQERMKAASEPHVDDAIALGNALSQRLAVVTQQLAELDEDRRIIVGELLHVGDAVAKLLQRAESASRLPAALEGWAGKHYIRIAFAFPDSDAERRARLEPLVDQLVELAQIPSGVDLVVRTATELAGSRGFEVKILKPDTVLRPDPIPLHLMSTFSRGQQLTAAILLYCTLVQLRARMRGRSQSAEDAGVLILDNPIGTCSNVRLLQLQRDIATQMRVQLIYTTGVEDLEALETLPNKIRLRNTHRDRATGDRHVTGEEPDKGIVEAVRLVEVPAR